MKNKDIAIASYWASNSNYGQVLQGVALQYILKEMGYTPFTIAYDMLAHDPYKFTLKDKIQRFFCDDVSILLHIKRRFNSIRKRETNYQNVDFSKREFDKFRNQYLELSKKNFHDIKALSCDKQIINCHAIIVGSDQVWTASSGPERRKYLLLEFVPSTKKKIAYAASFGRNKIAMDSERIEFIKELKTFDAIGVREKSGIELCRDLGVDSVWTLDPTLLLTKFDWMNIFKVNIKKRQKTATIYTLRAYDPTIIEITDYLRKLDYEIIYICSDEHYIDENANCEANPIQWIECIANSSIVITNSFHGSIFALNFNTPVIAVAREGKLNERINQRFYSILKKIGLLDNFISGFQKEIIDNLLIKNIDWSSINSIIEADRKSSRHFLENSLID